MQKDGEYAIQLAEDEIILRATPNVLRMILNKHGGIRQALQKVYMIEEEIMFDIMVAGISDGPKSPLAPSWKTTLRENIFKHGVINLVEPLTGFLTFLGNGGKHEVVLDEDDDEGKG